MTICDWATKYEEERIYHNEEWGDLQLKVMIFTLNS